MKKVLIIGSNGQLGIDLTGELNNKEDINLLTLNHSQIELCDKTSVYNFNRTTKP